MSQHLSPDPFTAPSQRELSRMVQQRQSEGRVPGMLGAVARHGQVVWSHGVGSADLSAPGVAATADTQFCVASNTKTFTAVLIMQLRDEGRLTLDDTVDQHMPETTHPGVTIRQLLAHTTGMQREPVGDVWDTLEFPTRQGLVEGWNEAQRIDRPHNHWHYSNLGYAMLGEIVARLDGREWEESLRVRLLEPLGMRRTALAPSAPAAGRYYVPPYSDVPLEEPLLAKNATAPVGGLFSTAHDMATWHGFLAAPDEQILAADTVEEMCQPQVVADLSGWTQAWGLGLMLVHRDDSTWVGHTGGMPGSITGIFTERSTGTTGLVLMNNSVSPDPAAGAIDLGAYADAHEPAPIAPWLPGTEQPEQLLPLVGRWFSEGHGFTFSIREGRLEARADGLPASRPPSVFEETATDVYRTASGRERGELLRIDRHSDGTVRQMNWATYRFTREPLSFADRVPHR